MCEDNKISRAEEGLQSGRLLPDKALLFFSLLFLSILPLQAYEWGTWTENVAEAKSAALQHNRPILAVLGMIACAHCDHLEEKILYTRQFLNYAAEQQLVLFHCRKDAYLWMRVTDTYRKTCGMSSTVPHVYLFKVKPGADLTSTAKTALDPDQVSLLEISSGMYAGTLSGVSYAAVRSINGIPIEKENNWTVDTFIRVLESFFPNRQFPSGEPGWASINPQPDGPGGYEDAIPLGAVPTSTRPPANGKDWIFTLAGSLSGESPERWYRFTGDESSRFILSATHMSGSMKFEFFRSDGEKPLSAIKTMDPITRVDLDRGVWLDSPIGNKKNQLYFLRLSHSGGTAATSLDYTLKLHQMAIKSPDAGAVGNPRWRGAYSGKWTMEMEAAKAAALQTARPVVFCFSGLRWSEFCVGAEHTAFADVAFNGALSDAYLVLADNRRQDGSGPSLLRENFEGGYLAANGITEAEAADTLDANLDLQNALALPGASADDPMNYPTFVYCRVEQVGEKKEIRPVGRFGFDAAFTPTSENVDEAFRKIKQLKYLDSKNYRESSMFPETSRQRLDAGAPSFTSCIGGLVTADWVKFSIAQGKSFQASIKAGTANDAAQVALAVYKADGKTLTLLKRVVGSLRDGSPELEYSPPNAAGGDFWLSVSAVNQDTPVEYQLTYRQNQLKNQVFFEKTEIPVARSETSVTLAIHRQILMPDPDKVEPFAMQYRVVVSEENTAPNWLNKLAKDWQNLGWDDAEKASGEKELELEFHVPEGAEPLPEGYWDFRVEMRVIEGDDYWEVSQESKDGAHVKIYSKAAFTLDEDLKTLRLYKGIPFKLVIPICKGGDCDTVEVGSLPAGLVMGLSFDGECYLAGTPEDTIESTDITLRLLNKGQETDHLAITLSIYELNETLSGLIAKDAFAGYLHSNTQGVTHPVGSLDLRKGGDGGFTATVLSKDSTEPVVFASAGWSYDPWSGGLLLEFPKKDGNALTLRLSADGVGTGFFRSAGGEYPSSFYPATATPTEYAGYYTVALRLPDSCSDDTENFARGWLLLDIEEDGKAEYSGEMEDGTTFTGKTWVYNQANDDWGTVAFFAHLKEAADSYSGYLGGLLEVTPKSKQTADNVACVSDCGGTSAWIKPNGENEERKKLFPCGAVYDSTKTLQAQIGDTDEFFYIETRFPEGNAAFAPNRVKLQEAGNFLNNTSLAKFGVNYSKLTKGADGVFTGTVDLLVPENQGDATLVKKNVPVCGVLTPATEDCCSISSGLYVGYGYYRWNGQVFYIRLRSDEFDDEPPIPPTPVLLKLGGQTENINYLFANKVLAEVSKPAKWLLYRKRGTTAWSSAVSAGTSVKVTLDPAFAWQFVAVDETMFESGILEIPLRKAEEVHTFNLDGGGGAVQLQPGWNLIAVPWNVKLAADAKLPAELQLFSYDPQQNVYVPTSEWTTGSAYWLFVTGDFDGFSLFGEIDNDATIPEEPAPDTWHFMARNDELTSDHIWHWDKTKFIHGVPTASTDGVWWYKEPDE